ncbi:MAG: hypothetical protein KH319_04440 [Butyricicoccus pullicaecorum]|jgi:hypothetical protein|nr:hypothetical protein [Butyricicoccus pullicaecorum]
MLVVRYAQEKKRLSGGQPPAAGSDVPENNGSGRSFPRNGRGAFSFHLEKAGTSYFCPPPKAGVQNCPFFFPNHPKE